ncbi:MAG: hypothetical protein JNL82_22135 [Myxococcales bacterium]|nr:hypothetical protein [Myxococcales bacterium]
MDTLTADELICGLQLPPALARALVERRWRRPLESHLRRVFRERPIRAEFYDLPALRHANRRWHVERDPAFVGHPDAKAPPGDIDPTRSLLLGVLGPDLPFALDYRVTSGEPRVVYLHSGGDRWITVARDIEQLLVSLHLDGLGERRTPASTPPCPAPR